MEDDEFGYWSEKVNEEIKPSGVIIPARYIAFASRNDFWLCKSLTEAFSYRMTQKAIIYEPLGLPNAEKIMVIVMLRQFIDAVDGSHAQVMATYHQAKQLLEQIEGKK